MISHSLRHPYPNELYHHGIKGQHWGVRNGPPYPLNKRLSNKIKSGKNETVRESSKTYRDKRSGKIKTTKSDKAGTTHYGSFWESRLSEVIDATDLDELVNVADILSSRDKDPSSVFFLDKKGRYLDEDDLAVVNQDIYKSDEKGLRNNCVKCSNSLELRRRGYNVVAGRSAHGMLNSATQYYWDGAVPYKERFGNIMSRITSFGNKGSGEFIARRADGSGHSVYFSHDLTGSDGKRKLGFFDGQTGEVYDSIESLYDAQGFDKSQFAQITRLDNATPNWKHMSEDSVSRMSYVNENMNRIWDNSRDLEFDPYTRWEG